MIHALVASFLPLLVFFGAWLRRGRRTSARALVLLVAACGLSSAWAVVPDMPRLWGDLEYYVELHHRRYCNVWGGHCAIDARDDIDSFAGTLLLIRQTQKLSHLLQAKSQIAGMTNEAQPAEILFSIRSIVSACPIRLGK